MTGRKKYIAILLCWIFTFPIVFQSLHIVVHHPSGYSQNNELCDGDAQTPSIQDKHAVESQKIELCFICAFHFSINDIPKASFFRSGLPLAQDLLKELVIQLPFQQLLSNKSPRAPPILR